MKETLKIEAKNENLAQVIDFVDEFLLSHNCSLKVQMQIELCVEELFVNIASYAYGENEGDAELTLEESGGIVKMTFIDGGIPYDPLAKPDPDVALAAEDRQIGGLGIFLVKKNMDSIEYEYTNGQNVLTMTKKID